MMMGKMVMMITAHRTVCSLTPAGLNAAMTLRIFEVGWKVIKTLRTTIWRGYMFWFSINNIALNHEFQCPTMHHNAIVAMIGLARGA